LNNVICASNLYPAVEKLGDRRCVEDKGSVNSEGDQNEDQDTKNERDDEFTLKIVV
jgi:hypothetical protein